MLVLIMICLIPLLEDVKGLRGITRMSRLTYGQTSFENQSLGGEANSQQDEAMENMGTDDELHTGAVKLTRDTFGLIRSDKAGHYIFMHVSVMQKVEGGMRKGDRVVACVAVSRTDGRRKPKWVAQIPTELSPGRTRSSSGTTVTAGRERPQGHDGSDVDFDVAGHSNRAMDGGGDAGIVEPDPSGVSKDLAFSAGHKWWGTTENVTLRSMSIDGDDEYMREGDTLGAGSTNSDRLNQEGGWAIAPQFTEQVRPLPPPLPPGWQALWAETRGQWYYWKPEGNAVQWETPATGSSAVSITDTPNAPVGPADPWVATASRQEPLDEAMQATEAKSAEQLFLRARPTAMVLESPPGPWPAVMTDETSDEDHLERDPRSIRGGAGARPTARLHYIVKYQANLQVIAVAWEEDDPSILYRPCVDCGRRTGSLCDICVAAKQVSSKKWVPGQRTPLCINCESKYGKCHHCGGVAMAPPPPWGGTPSELNGTNIGEGGHAPDEHGSKDGMLTEQQQRRAVEARDRNICTPTVKGGSDAVSLDRGPDGEFTIFRNLDCNFTYEGRIIRLPIGERQGAVKPAMGGPGLFFSANVMDQAATWRPTVGSRVKIWATFDPTGDGQVRIGGVAPDAQSRFSEGDMLSYASVEPDPPWEASGDRNVIRARTKHVEPCSPGLKTMLDARSELALRAQNREHAQSDPEYPDVAGTLRWLSVRFGIVAARIRFVRLASVIRNCVNKSITECQSSSEEERMPDGERAVTTYIQVPQSKGLMLSGNIGRRSRQRSATSMSLTADRNDSTTNT